MVSAPADNHYVQPGLPPVHPRTPPSARRHGSSDGQNEGSSPSFSASGPSQMGQARFSGSSNRVTPLVLPGQSMPVLTTLGAAAGQSIFPAPRVLSCGKT